VAGGRSHLLKVLAVHNRRESDTHAANHADHRARLSDTRHRRAKLAHALRCLANQIILTSQRAERLLSLQYPRGQQKEPASSQRRHSPDTTDRADSNLHRAGDLLRHIPKLVQAVSERVEPINEKAAALLT